MEGFVNSHKKIALFGGTYDPIHIGHINLAIHMLERHNFDQVFFCPAFCSPHKVDEPPKASISDRLKMIKLAIEDQPKFNIFEYESKRPSPSYTIQTVEHLRQLYPNEELYLILSDDSIKDFPKWEGVNNILKMVTVLVGSGENKLLQLESSFYEIIKGNITKIPIFEVSSSEIRERLKKNLYCSHLLSSKVLKYIDKHQLYRP